MTKIQDTLFIAGRDQVYLVSLRESYRNEIIPYRVSLPVFEFVCLSNHKLLTELHTSRL